MLRDWIAHLVGGIFPAQECLVRLAMDWAPEMFSYFGTNLDTCLMERVRIQSAPFLLNGNLILLIRFLHSMRNEYRR